MYGLAAREPESYCKMLKTKMTKLPLDFTSFNLLGHQWVLDQVEIYGTIEGAHCDGTHKMPECDFVDIVVGKLELFMPKFIDIYRRDELIGQAWSSELLLRHITNIAAKGNFKIEKEARHQHLVGGHEQTPPTPTGAAGLPAREKLVQLQGQQRQRLPIGPCRS